MLAVPSANSELVLLHKKLDQCQKTNFVSMLGLILEYITLNSKQNITEFTRRV